MPSIRVAVPDSPDNIERDEGGGAADVGGGHRPRRGLVPPPAPGAVSGGRVALYQTAHRMFYAGRYHELSEAMTQPAR